jgi:hypothetical protein
MTASLGKVAMMATGAMILVAAFSLYRQPSMAFFLEAFRFCS